MSDQLQKQMEHDVLKWCCVVVVTLSYDYNFNITSDFAGLVSNHQSRFKGKEEWCHLLLLLLLEKFLFFFLNCAINAIR